ncbi:N-formylglutamate amidohydrolase [Xanthobacter autotrophicus]|uniref:N-formylglutamate amidohydrolase n=1 Tax=Xanthobacter autotrophicus TaxID=280 RepID=UPI0024A6221F|nr:N-formylglutamate amidohydrolase [Xanthobacter autotrophicus]MDI4656317.1 N-formylglutamate amidohydrolase [Xanthobacter autotrophicus]
MSPVTMLNAEGASAFLIVADHAGNAFPRSMGRLGISEDDQARHIAWDIGIAGVCRTLAERLDATLIQQNYSRLIIDCNRPPAAPSSIPQESEATPIPGNFGLGDAARAARERDLFQPYHACIAAELDRRAKAGRPAVLVAMHSFTPVYLGVARPWQVGVLYNRDARFAGAVLAALRQDSGLTVGDNEPYSVDDTTDYTIPVHAERRGLLHTGIEIRQDLITEPAGQAEWAARMARALAAALETCPPDRAPVPLAG